MQEFELEFRITNPEIQELGTDFLTDEIADRFYEKFNEPDTCNNGLGISNYKLWLSISRKSVSLESAVEQTEKQIKEILGEHVNIERIM